MKKRQLGSSDLYVSEIGLGCMSLGTDYKKAQSVIEAALAEGINYFDTADLYDFGENEEIVGKALRSVREQVIIATKAGNRWTDAKDSWTWDPSKAYIKEAVKQSLRRLDTDYIDLYQLHGGTIEDRIEETIEAFEELRAEGYIKYYGISSIRPNVIREYVQKSNMVSVMMQYSMLDRRPEEEVLPLLHEKGISVVTRGTVAKGMLSDRMLEKATAKGYLDYTPEELEEILPLLKEKLAPSRSLTEVAIQYNLSNPAVASVVAGASTVQQVKENARAAGAALLAQEEIQLIRSITKSNKYEQHR
ncbi:aldo/keto reductase [Mesobacillus subterraneus]|uniref:Aldo/keto reductase n=1 Tax=Mesobacillus subterraneus TaxID=285983 RepID=A0A427TSU9_9BACI|nr:aldo/keto reductase [Mesobacillus subterraneus]RSD27326.1 aldo/keto reductase [Mesobacillus subterraneus]